MDKRITGLIRHFDGLASPSYVPETPLPRDPGKSASLPLAEALSIVEPGSTATLLLVPPRVLCADRRLRGSVVGGVGGRGGGQSGERL